MDAKILIKILLSSTLIMGVSYSHSYAQSTVENGDSGASVKQLESSNSDEMIEAIEDEKPLTEETARKICEEYAEEEKTPENEKEAYLASCITELIEANEPALTEESANKICEQYATEEGIAEKEKETYLSSCVTELLASEAPLTEESAKETCEKDATEEGITEKDKEAYLSSCVTELMADDKSQDADEVIPEETTEKPVLEEKETETNNEPKTKVDK